MKFGGGWEFTSAPKGPDQVTYTLSFATMKMFADSHGRLLTGIEPEINIARLEKFYNRHRMWKRFTLHIPGTGNLTVRFAKPLDYKTVAKGEGTVEAFDLKVITQP